MIKNIVWAGVAALCVSFSSILFAGDAQPPLPLPVKKEAPASQKAPLVVRTESLELPGLTACHQCEWRPKPNERAAPEQCGTGADGKPIIAEFECGFSQECDRVCNFVRCLTPP